MIGLTLVTLFLLAMCFEVAREAHGWGVPASARDWTVKHYTAMTKVPKPEFAWWAERKTGSEIREHRQRWDIDLLGRTKIKELKK